MPTLAVNALVALLAVAQENHVGDSVTLADALTRARAGRPQTAAAAAVVERGRGAGRVATLVPNPSAQLETDEFAPTRKLTVVQPLGWLVRRPADLAVGHAITDRAAADSVQIIANLDRDVRRSFFVALADDEQLRLLREQATLADSLVTLANRRMSAGDISALERDQIAQEASRARLASWAAGEEASVARIDLARAIAWLTPLPPRPVGALDEGIDQTALEATEALAVRADQLTAIPAMRASLADSVAAAARLRSARWAQLPVPNFIAGSEWGGDPAQVRGTILGLSLPLPFWSQGQQAVAEASGIAAEQAARTAEARLTLASQLAAARTRVRESARRARFARDSLMTEARRVRAGAVRLYDAGRTGILPVFEALRAEREVARTMAQALLAFQLARADLAALLGTR